MCNDCYSNFPFTLPLPSLPTLSIRALYSPFPLQTLCICPSLAACLFGVDSPACLSIVIALAQHFTSNSSVSSCLPRLSAPPFPLFPSCLLPATPLFIWRICYPYTDATFGQRSLLCKMHVQHTMSLSKLWGANFSRRFAGQQGATEGGRGNWVL